VNISDVTFVSSALCPNFNFKMLNIVFFSVSFLRGFFERVLSLFALVHVLSINLLIHYDIVILTLLFIIMM